MWKSPNKEVIQLDEASSFNSFFYIFPHSQTPKNNNVKTLLKEKYFIKT